MKANLNLLLTNYEAITGGPHKCLQIIRRAAGYASPLLCFPRGCTWSSDQGDRLLISTACGQTPATAHLNPYFPVCLPKPSYLPLTIIAMGGFFEFICNQLAFKPQPVAAGTTLEGKTILITGANIGLGFEAARELAMHKPSRLILGVRDVEKGETARASILKISPEVDIDVWTLDYNEYDSLIAFAERVATVEHLDYVLLNAGIKMMAYQASHRGHEMNVQINHLGTSLLSLLLLPTLQTSAKVTGHSSRLTIVTSEGHFWVPFHERTASNILARLDEKESFGTAMQRYYTSKLLNILWTRELASRINYKEVIINTVNPGLCYSSLHRHEKTGIIKIVLWLFGWSSEQGGHCLADALVEHDNSHGQYLSLQKIMEYEFPYPTSDNADRTILFTALRSLSFPMKAKLHRSRYGRRQFHS